MAHILLAGTQKTYLRIKAHLDEHQVMHGASFDDVMAITRSYPVDLIVCGLIFDDSKTFDLLTAVRNDKALSQVPFVIVRTEKGALGEDMVVILKDMTQAMGGHFLDVYALSRQKERHEVNDTLKTFVAGLLNGQSLESAKSTEPITDNSQSSAN